MILTTLPALQIDLHHPDKASAHPAEYARVRSFMRLAHQQRDGRLSPALGEQGEPTVYRDRERFLGIQTRVYNFDFVVVRVDPDSGRLVYYLGGQPAKYDLPNVVPEGNGVDRVLPRALTDAEAGRIAARLYAASGWPGGIQVDHLRDMDGSSGTCVVVSYHPTWQGVPYEGDGTIDLDRQTGRLESFGAPTWLASPPESGVPGGTPDQARLAALRTVSAWRGEPITENPRAPLHLVLAYRSPAEIRVGSFAHEGTRPALQSYGPEHVAAFRAGRAILAYVGMLDSESGVPYRVTLDARTGLLLSAFDPRPGPGEAGGLTPKAEPAPLAVPTAERPWRVATGAKGWDAWSAPAKSSLVPTSDPAPTGTKLTLTDGKAAFPATYDPKTGLLGVSGKAYRPGPALADLLKRRAKWLREGG